MKLSIFLTLAFLCFLLWTSMAESTILTYVVEREIDQEDTLVELTLKIEVDGRSLKENIQTGQRVIENIRKVVGADCEANLGGKKSKKECKDLVDASKFEVEPKYHLVRKIPTFTLFILTHEVTIKIKNTKTIGKLIDSIVEAGEDLVTLQEFNWAAENEVDPEIHTLKDGLQEGKQLCLKLGKKLVQVLSVEELEEEEEEGQEEEDDGRDDDLAEIETELTIFKFKVRCDDTKANKTAKNK